jgi:hypothetical protein
MLDRRNSKGVGCLQRSWALPYRLLGILVTLPLMSNRRRQSQVGDPTDGNPGPTGTPAIRLKLLPCTDKTMAGQLPQRSVAMLQS